MAMSFNENLDDNGEMHEINVTPFIDVMLVLLIIPPARRSRVRKNRFTCQLKPIRVCLLATIR